MDREREGLVLLLLQEGSVGHAIELYQEEAGVEPEEARRAVKRLAGQHGIPQRRLGYLPFLLAGLAVLLGGVLALQFS